MTLLKRAVSAGPYCYWNHLFAHRTEALPQAPRIDPGYRLHFPVDVTGFSNDTLTDVAIDYSALLARVAAGDVAGLITWHGQIVHRSLVQTAGIAPMEGDRCAFLLGWGEKYVHSCFTSPAHRGRGLYSGMLHRIAEFYVSEPDAPAVFIACRQGNRASIKAILRAGFRYQKSSIVIGFAAGRVRLRRWYVARDFDQLASSTAPLASAQEAP